MTRFLHWPQALLALLLLLFFASALDVSMDGGQEALTSPETWQHDLLRQSPIMTLSQTQATWYHDCSNLTAFDGMGDNSWVHVSGVDVSFGSLASTGGYIYAADFGTGSAWHGPLNYHTLSSPFRVSEFVRLEADLEMSASSADRRGELWVSLHDGANRTVAALTVADPWTAQDDVHADGLWKFSNDSVTITPITWPDYAAQQPYRETLVMTQNETGIFVDVPRIGNFMLVGHEETEPSRMITYVSVSTRAYGSASVCETMRIHDVRLVYEQTSSPTTTTSTSTTTTTSTSTTTSADQPPLPMAFVAAFGGIAALVLIVVVYVQRKKPSKERLGTKLEPKPPPPPRTGAVASDVNAPVAVAGVEALRGGEFTGNRFRYKVKVANNSDYVITDATVTLLSYPRDSLKLDGEVTKIIPKIDSEGFRSPSFEFTPTQDCVKGDIVASVSFVDHKGVAHSLTTQPYTIRAVCDLLTPESITPEDFKLKLASMNHGELVVEVKEWTPEEMGTKTLTVLEASNFYEVSSESSKVGEYTEIRVTGWAKGKYTGKNVGIEITITGKPGVQGATCLVRMSGEDEAMILPAIDEISQKLGAWLCPRCSGVLPIDSVKELKDGRSAVCPFCGVTMDR